VTIPSGNRPRRFIFIPPAKWTDDLLPQLIRREKFERSLATDLRNGHPLFENRIETQVRHAREPGEEVLIRENDI
jgi:hypothetical protein